MVAQPDPSQIRELSVGETSLAHEAVYALRPAYASEREFVDFVDHTLRGQGYRLIGAFVSGQEQAVAAAGFRVLDSLALGHHLVVDDLSTAPRARKQGHARALLGWLMGEGRRLDCGQLHLDSAVGADRFDAHRFYHAGGLSIYAHHFAIAL